jgi:hypothetical protein
MTDPILKAVHLKTTSPPERFVSPILSFCVLCLMKPHRSLLRLVNRRDVLALAHENLASAHDLILRQLSNSEVENLQINKENQELVRELLELTRQDDSWREILQDATLASQLDDLEADLIKRKAQWEVMKSVASAMVVGSGLDWAEDEKLQALVLDESDD